MSQMQRFGESLRLYAQGRDSEVEWYPGEHTKRLALELSETLPESFADWQWAKVGGTRVLEGQRSDLGAFGTEFDFWARESHLDPGIASMDAASARGELYWNGKGGPICCLCARPIVPGEPCASCRVE